MFLAAQLVSIITIVATVIGLLSKDKFKTMIWLTLANISMLVTYFLLGRYFGCLMVAGATLRTFIYFLYAKFNKKPQLVFVIAFEIYFIALSLFLWKDYSDLFMLANLCLVTYTTWQNNMSIFRVGYIFSSIFLVTYDIIVGAYVGCVSEVIMLIVSVWALIKYGVLNKIDDIVLDFYSTISPTYDIKISNDDGLCYVDSSKIKDEFNNFCYLGNPNDLEQNLQTINKHFDSLKREPAVYIKSVNQENMNIITNEIKKHKLLFHDCWMKLRTSFQVKKIKCQLDDVAFRLATPADASDVLFVFDAGFINYNGNDVYKYSKEYYDRYKMVLENNMLEKEKIFPYIAFHKDEAIAVLFVYTHGSNAYICQITTLKKYRRMGVASNLIGYAIKDQRKRGIEEFFLVTEKYTPLETFYMHNNFEEIAQGFCLSVKSDAKQRKKKAAA